MADSIDIRTEFQFVKLLLEMKCIFFDKITLQFRFKCTSIIANLQKNQQQQTKKNYNIISFNSAIYFNFLKHPGLINIPSQSLEGSKEYASETAPCSR